MKKGWIKRFLVNLIGVLLIGLMAFVIIGMCFGVFREGAILL